MAGSCTSYLLVDAGEHSDRDHSGPPVTDALARPCFTWCHACVASRTGPISRLG